MPARKSFRTLMIESLAERINFAATYFIDPVAGNDLSSGLSPAAALKTPQRLVSQYVSLQPANHIDLVGGDTIVLMPGLHNFTYKYGEGQWQGMFFRNVHGSAEHPITIQGQPGAQVRNIAPDGTEIASIGILQSSHLVVHGLEISGVGPGISVAESLDVRIRNNYIHDVTGSAHDNIAGVYLTGGQQIYVENNLLSDNYDRSRIGNANNRHIVVFGSIDTHIIGNTMVSANPQAGMAVDYKHLGGLLPNSTVIYEVAYNTIVNAAGTAIGTSAPNSYIHHNLLIDSGAIKVADFGGTDQLFNERIEFNTIINRLDRPGAGALDYYPNEYPGYSLGQTHWRNNLVIDRRAYDHPEKSTITIDRYGADEFYRRAIQGGLFQADQNIYDVQAPLRFDAYSAKHGSYGPLGDVYSLSEWQSLGFDRSGTASNVGLDEFYRPQLVGSANAGIYAGTVPKLTVLLEKMDIDESGSGASVKLRIVRSGGALDKALPITLQASRAGQINLPQQVLMAAGQNAIEVEVIGLADATIDSLMAIQIEAQAAGWQNGSNWLRLHDAPSAVMESGIYHVPIHAGNGVVFESQVLQRWAEYNNEIGLAYVDDAAGRVGDLMPGDAGWIQALTSRQQHLTLLPSGVQAGTVTQHSLTPGRYFVLYLVQDALLTTWQATNPTNTLNARPLLFVSIPSANPDQVDHLHETLADDSIEMRWEDLVFGGDFSFRDLVVLGRFIEPEPTYCRAVGDTFALLAEDGPAVLDVLSNDMAPRPLRINSVTQSMLGSLAINSDSTGLTFIPTAGRYGRTEFEYTALCDAQSIVGHVLGEVSKRWTNDHLPTDVNGDGLVTPVDALLVINVLNLEDRYTVEPFPDGVAASWAMVDVNRDGYVSAVDALLVILDLF